MREKPITERLRADAVAVLDAVLTWRLHPAQWDRVERDLDEMINSWAGGGTDRFSAATHRMMLLAPRRVETDPLELPEQAPEPIRDRVNRLKRWLRDEPDPELEPGVPDDGR